MRLKHSWFRMTVTLVLACLFGCDQSDAGSENQTIDILSSSSSSGSSASSSASGPIESHEEDSFVVVDHFPPAGAENIALVATIRVGFSLPVLDHSFDDDFLALATSRSPVPGQVRRLDDRSFELVPDAPLSPNTEYEVTVGYAMAASGAEHSDWRFSFSTAANVGGTSQAVLDRCMDSRDIAMLAEVNGARAVARSCGSSAMPAVASLSWNCQLAEAAEAHSDDMAEVDFFSHAGSDGSSSADRLSRTGYRWSSVRENIAAGQQTVEQVVSGFLSSEGHCRNLMADDVSHFGFAYAENQNSVYRRYWTQLFAAPR